MTDAAPLDAVVLRSVDGRGIATLTLNRPRNGNSYNQAMLDALLREVVELGADAAVRIIVLRGSGKHFCVGAEIGAATPAAEGPRTTIPALCLELDAVPKPTVALVHGACIGGGVALVSCCDVVLAAGTAFFALPEVRLGFAPGPLIPFFLRAIEVRSLRRYLLSGERFAAGEAKRVGTCPRALRCRGRRSGTGAASRRIAAGRTKRRRAGQRAASAPRANSTIKRASARASARIRAMLPVAGSGRRPRQLS